MSDRPRACAPNPDEIERRFRGPAVSVVRPAIRGCLGVLRGVRGFSWRGEGLEHVTTLDQPFMIAANHASHADTGAILDVLPAPIRNRTCVAAALDVFGPADRATAHRIAVVRRECLQVLVAAGFHAFAFDRHGSSLSSIRTAMTLVNRGWNLLLYPEGTRSRNGRIAPFKSGVGVLARKTGVPVIPVHVTGGRVVLPIGRTLPQSGQIVVRFGAPMRPATGESTADFVRRVQDTVRSLAPADSTVAADDARASSKLASVRP